MFKVFVVDDEIAAREAIRAAVPWQRLELELAGETADGELALQLLREARPDVLITDIHMPYMDGMELCRRVRRELPEARIVIVSACAEFERAREALELGVRAFLPKPVDAAALRTALERVAAELTEARARREREAALRECLEASGRYLRERLLEELYGGADAQAVLRSARAMRMNLAASRYRVVALRPESGPAGERALQVVHDALERMTDAGGGTAFLLRSGAEFSLLVLGDGAEHVRARAEELAAAACREARRAAGVELRAALGAEVEHLEDAAASLASACARLGERTGEGGARGAVPLSLPELAPLMEELRNAAPADAEAIFDRRARALGAERSEAVMDYLCVEALLAAARIAREAGSDAAEALPGEDEAATPRACRAALRRALELRDARSPARHAGMIRKARAYIDAHFADPGLALRDVAAHVALSNNHFCTVFARETGVTFSEYLTRLRIGRAKELLRDTGLRAGEIAYAVGYNDPHYFSNLFKKVTGISPRDYRRGENIKKNG